MTRGIPVAETDYKALCKELFGTTEETKIRELAAKWNVFGTNSGLQNADLTAELGIKGYIGPVEAHKAFAHQTWHLYTANSVRSQSLLSGAAWDAAPEASAYAPV